MGVSAVAVTTAFMMPAEVLVVLPIDGSNDFNGKLLSRKSDWGFSGVIAAWLLPQDETNDRNGGCMKG